MKKAYLLLLAGMLSTAVFAGSKQTIKIDGQVIEKTVSEITFDVKGTERSVYKALCLNIG